MYAATLRGSRPAGPSIQSAWVLSPPSNLKPSLLVESAFRAMNTGETSQGCSVLLQEAASLIRIQPLSSGRISSSVMQVAIICVRNSCSPSKSRMTGTAWMSAAESGGAGTPGALSAARVAASCAT